MDKRSGNLIFSKEFRSSFKSFIGVDLHKTTVTLQAVDPVQDKISWLRTDTKCIDKIADGIDTLPKPCWMAVEAFGFIEWFLERFGICVERIDIADATALASLRGKRRKTDPNDALDIAMRLAEGNCPLGWIADRELMAFRKLGRHWRRLSRTISRANHGMKSILNAANIRGPHVTGAGAQKWFLTYGHLLMSGDDIAFADLLDIIQTIERQRERLRLRIIKVNRCERFSGIVNLLKSVPDIDEIWACIITAEVGDFSRFPNADTIEYWAGLTPDNKESAGRTQSGSITKTGSVTLRWALCQAAITMCKSDQAQENKRQRLLKRIGKAKANVAMGRNLLRIIYAMMRDNKAFERSEATNHLTNANRTRARKQRKKSS